MNTITVGDLVHLGRGRKVWRVAELTDRLITLETGSDFPTRTSIPAQDAHRLRPTTGGGQ